jgi:hypothetical protein
MEQPIITRSIPLMGGRPGTADPPSRSRGAKELDGVREATTILDAIHAAPDGVAHVAAAAEASTARRASLVAGIREVVDDPSDRVTAAAAVHALARVPGQEADVVLGEILEDAGSLAAHAAWALDRRPFTPCLVDPLVRRVAEGKVISQLQK